MRMPPLSAVNATRAAELGRREGAHAGAPAEAAADSLRPARAPGSARAARRADCVVRCGDGAQVPAKPARLASDPPTDTGVSPLGARALALHAANEAPESGLTLALYFAKLAAGLRCGGKAMGPFRRDGGEPSSRLSLRARAGLGLGVGAGVEADAKAKANAEAEAARRSGASPMSSVEAALREAMGIAATTPVRMAPADALLSAVGSGAGDGQAGLLVAALRRYLADACLISYTDSAGDTRFFAGGIANDGSLVGLASLL